MDADLNEDRDEAVLSRRPGHVPSGESRLSLSVGESRLSLSVGESRLSLSVSRLCEGGGGPDYKNM